MLPLNTAWGYKMLPPFYGCDAFQDFYLTESPERSSSLPLFFRFGAHHNIFISLRRGSQTGRPRISPGPLL